MRTVLVTGPGGAGRTTVAAVTALAAAREGERVLLLSTDPDPGESLSAAREAGVRAERIDSGAHFRTELLALQERGTTALELLGAARLDEEELTELPGAEQFALLHALRTVDSAAWDLTVVDMPPVQEALAVLALPEQLRRYLRRLLPPERQAARALRPMLAQLAGVPMPAQWLYDTTARWETELAAVQARIDDPDTTVRLVAEPGPAATRALRTARTGIALHRHTLDLVVANRVLPAGSRDPWLAALAEQQQEHLKELTAGFGDGVHVQELPHLGRAPAPPESWPRWNARPPPRRGPGVEHRRPARRRRCPGLAAAAARRGQGGTRPGPARRRTAAHRRAVPQDRQAPVGAAPLHGRRRGADGRRAGHPVRARSTAVAAEPVNAAGPFGYRREYGPKPEAHPSRRRSPP